MGNELGDQGEAREPDRADELRRSLDQARRALADVRDRSSSAVSATLTRLLEISGAMNRLRDRDELLTYLRDRLQELFDARNAAVVLFEDGGPRVLCPPGEEPREVSHAVLARARETRAPFLVSDTSADEGLRDRSSVRRLQLGSVLCAPLLVDGAVIGVIEFDHPGRPSPFSEESLATLELFAHQAGTALQNVITLEHLTSTLARLRDAQTQLVASERLRAVGEMAAAVAHDFNNLLTSMLGLGELIAETPGLPDAARKDVEVQQMITRTGAEVVARLQRFAGPGDDDAAPELLDIAEVVKDVAAITRYRFREGLSHRLTIVGGDVEPVLGRPAEMRELLLNLVFNAVEAAPDGGRVEIRFSQRDGAIVLEVEDDGPGIAPAVGGRVFEPFFSTKATGHGLGLSICWRIVSRMNGAIRYERGDEGGCVFIIELPAAPPDARTTPTPTEVRARPRAARVLLVDDEPDVRGVLTRVVRRAGHEVTSAGSGAEAIDLLERESFDLVVSDIAMPAMSGIELAKELRRRGKRCPLVLMTGWSRPLDVQQASSEGVSVVLRKPIGTSEMSRAIAQALEAS